MRPHLLAALPRDDLINGGDLTRLLVQPAGAVLVPPPRSGCKCVEEELRTSKGYHWINYCLAENIIMTGVSLRWSSPVSASGSEVSAIYAAMGSHAPLIPNVFPVLGSARRQEGQAYVDKISISYA